jgi:hypothetical protein
VNRVDTDGFLGCFGLVWVLVVLEFELRTQGLLGKHSLPPEPGVASRQ